jgi:phosphatidylinositol phospholipase C, gamma-1
VSDIFQLYSTEKIMSLQDFQTFMDKEQRDMMENDERSVSKFMRDFLNDPAREVQEPFFTNNEVSQCKKVSS